jgi:hypothetical protein
MSQKEKTRCTREEKIERIEKPGGHKQHGESEVLDRTEQKQERRAGKTVGKKKRAKKIKKQKWRLERRKRD